ncbi:hypothetical protein U1Q18_027104 [Sarracenia purpurea var. burkii]
MDWCHKMVFPVRRVWAAVAGQFKAPKNGAGLLKLRHDIQTCGYEDVQVMWEMLRSSDSDLVSNRTKHKRRPFWRIFLWSNHCIASPFSTAHA